MWAITNEPLVLINSMLEIYFGFAQVCYECYFQTDLDVLQNFIDQNNNLEGYNILEIGIQSWEEGLLKQFHY